MIDEIHTFFADVYIPNSDIFADKSSTISSMLYCYLKTSVLSQKLAK